MQGSERHLSQRLHATHIRSSLSFSSPLLSAAAATAAAVEDDEDDVLELAVCDAVPCDTESVVGATAGFGMLDEVAFDDVVAPDDAIFDSDEDDDDEADVVVVTPDTEEADTFDPVADSAATRLLPLFPFVEF